MACFVVASSEDRINEILEAVDSQWGNQVDNAGDMQRGKAAGPGNLEEMRRKVEAGRRGGR